MTAASTAQGAGRDDPLYHKGLAHLQAGEWDDAVRCFEQVLKNHPGSRAAQAALEEARFKARLDGGKRVRARRWIIPWRSILMRAAILLVIAVLAVQGVRLINRQVAPTVAKAVEEQRLTKTEEEGNAFLDGAEWDAAETRFRAILDEQPDHAGALRGMAIIAEERRVEADYEQAVALQEAGDFDAAVQLYTGILVSRPRYKDVSQRIDQIARQRELEELLAEAEEDYRQARVTEAISKFEQIRDLEAGYQRELVSERLHALYLQAGRDILDRDPPEPQSVPEALEYFTLALTLNPRGSEAIDEQRRATLFLQGQDLYHQGMWDQAIARLATVYEQRADYLGDTVINMLYESYITSGDQHRDRGDPHYAYEQYRKAEGLPVVDKALARGRIFYVSPLLTPTATPTLTPTPTPTPTPTLIPTPTPIRPPTPTPTPPPMSQLRNKIVFFSMSEEGMGWWYMDPDGENRRFLGRRQKQYNEYAEIQESHRLSPDGLRQVYVAVGPNKRTPQVYWRELLDPSHKPQNELVTDFAQVSYDPVWSPNGQRIAFASQESGSDDIWIIYPNGEDARNLTQNDWEWDKMPSWSPDSSRIVFWSNREGRKQIYVMDADGRNVRNISNTDWDEYDCIWVR
jgi:TolB protein